MRGPDEGCEFRFSADPFGVVADGDEQVAGHLRVDAVEVADHGWVDGDDRVEFGVDKGQFPAQVR